MVARLYEHALIGWDAPHRQHQQRSATTAGGAASAAFVIPASNNIGSGNGGLLQTRAFGTTTSSSATTNGGHRDYQRHTNKKWGVGMDNNSRHRRSVQAASSSTTNGGASTSLRAFSSQSSSPSSSTTPTTSSKLSSSRAAHAISLLPSYLIDARSITKYCKLTAPHGALQLSVAENQLCELEVDGVCGIVEGGDDDNVVVDGVGRSSNNSSSNMTLVQVLSQLASSTSNRPTSGLSCGDDTCFAKDMIYYQPTQGSPGLRASMVDYLDTLLLKSSSSSSSSLSSKKRTFNDDNIILGAGCNAVLENLCMCLCEPGDAVMIPTPYYAAFEFDLVARAGCEIVPVNTLDFHESPPPPSSPSAAGDDERTTTTIPPSFYYPNRASLTHAYNRSIEETSRPPRVLLLSHPNNPLGICYPPEVMKECIDWCREHEVHLISDEIYAGSVYRPKNDEEKDTFVSAMSLASGHEEGGDGEKGGLGLGPYIHLVYALSKDFALSGLRVGVAYTENEEILLPMQKLNDLCQISSQTQLLVERMLSAHVAGSNEKFVDVYLKSNRNNIRTRCDKLQQCLSDMDIPYLPADSGLFVWMDFREFLPELEESITEETESLSSKEHRERQLYLKLMKEYGLLFTPGMSMRNERAGFFRCVFTAASEEEFELGLERIRTFVKEQREG
jgi:aspartate/methionine/tyrosine aminotransferase